MKLINRGNKGFGVLGSMKIKTKLIFSFIIISLLIGVVGFIGITDMQKLDNNTKNIYNSNLKGISIIKEVKINLQAIRTNILLILEESKRSQIQSLESEIQALTNEDSALLEDYKGTISTSEEQQLYDEFYAELMDYRSAREELIGLVNENNYEEALIKYTKVSEIRENMFDILDELIQFNETDAKNAFTNNQDVFNSSLTIIIAIIIAGLLLSLAFGLIISTWIGKRLNTVVNFAEAFGD